MRRATATIRRVILGCRTRRNTFMRRQAVVHVFAAQDKVSRATSSCTTRALGARQPLQNPSCHHLDSTTHLVAKAGLL